ncbi:MAG: heparinase II/III family protein, partial [Ignavibacteria bacterium]|nr:heparinase II/III family protein [Ignavibacteria bacterium]
NDGVDYEKSTFYQRLVLEIIYNAQIALSLNGQSLSQASLQKMEKMFDFISSYIVDDTIPNVGDNDNGRVTQFSFSEKVDDLRYLISIRNLLFNNSQDEVLKENLSSDALFLFGVKGVNFLKSEIAKTKDSHNKTQLNSKSFLEGGFFILRNNDWFIFIDAGDIGMNGWGGHGHNDVFSFELFYKKRKFICDSGTYCYTSNPELRQQFRSTYSHNTIVVNKTEQAEFLNLFRIKDDFTQPRILEWKSNPNSDLLIVEHYGYTRLKHPVIHRRKFEFNKADDVVVISDYIDGRNKHEIEYNLHFAPDVSIESISETGFLLSINQIKLLLEFSSDADLKIKIVESKYSKSYGLLEENKKIYFSIFSKLPITITTSIKPKL